MQQCNCNYNYKINQQMNWQKIININENEIAYYDKTCIKSGLQ